MLPRNTQTTCAANRHEDGETEVSSTMLAGSYPVRLHL
jgi:hypothetical protein